MSIIDHWGDYGQSLAPWAGPGHWHDMDMLLIGSHCLTTAEERTQMAIWSISASPLIMGNDLRNVSADSKAILLNKNAIAVSQDSLGQMGIRLSPGTTKQQVWARNMANGDVAVALYNKDSSPADITVRFDQLHLYGKVTILDIWSNKSLGTFTGQFTSAAVGVHDTEFLRLSQ